MRYIFLALITIYQYSISVVIKNILGTASVCRFSPSCSEYAKESIAKYGTIKGVYISAIRILTCRPSSI